MINIRTNSTLPQKFALNINGQGSTRKLMPPSEIVKGTFKMSVCVHDIYGDDLRRIPGEKCAIKCEDARVGRPSHT